MKKNFLKQIRTHKGLTLKDVAVPAEVSPQAISNFENGRINLGKAALERVAKVLDVSVDQINNTGINKFDAEDHKILSECMTSAHEMFPDLEQKEVVGIAMQTFKLHFDHLSAIKNNEEEKFEEALKMQLTNGLAAKIFLNKLIPT